MKDFNEMLIAEIKRTENLIEKANQFMEKAPKGSMHVRKRKKQNSYYWEFAEKKGKHYQSVQININDNKEMIRLLTRKMVNREILKRGKNNLKLLELLQKGYKSLNPRDIEHTQHTKYQNVLREDRDNRLSAQISEPYPKAPFNPKFHKHETDCGIFVRSKSEQILVNALYAHGIPFHYEEEFLYEVGSAGRIYPDITIFLPDGRRIIWEHLGLLSDENYCLRTAKKLNIYQLNGYTLGENLIITMDDSKGNFSSGTINRIIREQILPYF